MPLSNAPVRRAKQLENLRPVGAVSHGATSEGKLKRLRAQHRTSCGRFPQLDCSGCGCSQTCSLGSSWRPTSSTFTG
jgi:hypothetical protein